MHSPYQYIVKFALVLALFSTAPTGRAQPSEPVDETQPPATEQPAETLKEPPPTAPENAAQSDQSPFDYRSSEEISEDRSVSFPVDI